MIGTNYFDIFYTLSCSHYIDIIINTGLSCYQKDLTATIECGATIEGANDATLYGPTGYALATKAIKNDKVKFDITDIRWGETYTVRVGGQPNSNAMYAPGMTYFFTFPKSLSLHV